MEFDSNSLYKVSKSYAERYNEYRSILTRDSHEMFSVREKWGMYLEICMNRSSHGWYAYWNVLRSYCDALKITFPKVVRVQVNDISYENLSANVSIVNSHDDAELYSIPSEIESVPLKDLYVGEDLEDVEVVGDCLDQLRFFYHHLWWSWVDDENDVDVNNKSIDWVRDHLEDRLTLYYDKLGTNISYTLAKKIKRFMEKCKESYELLRNNDLEPMVTHRVSNELNSMKVELNQWCIPEIRKLKNEEIKRTNSGPSLLIAMQENEMLNIETYLIGIQDTLAQEKLDDLPIKLISPNFEDCHLNYDANDTIILMPGHYELNYMEYFDFPVVIKGLSNSSGETVISDTRSFLSIFQFLATTVKVENIDFHLNSGQLVFSIKRGTLILNNVQFNSTRFEDTIAIKLLKNTKLVAQQCRFSNFNTAIVCQQGSVVELVDCVFENNSSCIQFVEGVKITMNNCDLTNTECAPFIYEKYSNESEMEQDCYESLEYLSKIHHIDINQVQLDDENVAVERVYAKK